MMARRFSLMVAAIVGFGLGTAHAQNPQAGVPGNAPPPVTPPGATATPPEKVAPDAGSASSLTDTLSRDRGTVTPPPVDPGITRKPPAGTGDAMPVIPPPGSAGGDRSVVPK